MITQLLNMNIIGRNH